VLAAFAQVPPWQLMIALAAYRLARLRDATYTAITMAFPAMPSHSLSRHGRHSRTAGHISWAHETTRKKTPYTVYSGEVLEYEYCGDLPWRTGRWRAEVRSPARPRFSRFPPQ